jgi:hypothetical protein
MAPFFQVISSVPAAALTIRPYILGALQLQRRLERAVTEKRMMTNNNIVAVQDEKLWSGYRWEQQLGPKGHNK